MESLFESFEGGEVIRRKGFALENGEVDFHLVEPTGMDRRMDRHDGRPAFLDAIDTGLAAMGRAVVHDPEDSASRAVWLLGHDIGHEPAKWSDAGGLLASTLDFRPVDIPRSQISPGALALVFMFGAHGLAGRCRQCGMDSLSGLDTGLFVGR